MVWAAKEVVWKRRALKAPDSGWVLFMALVSVWIKYCSFPVILGPNITGLVTSPSLDATGCFIRYRDDSINHMIVTDITSKYPLYGSIGFNASLSNTIYSNSKTVQPISLVFNYVIKY